MESRVIKARIQPADEVLVAHWDNLMWRLAHSDDLMAVVNHVWICWLQDSLAVLSHMRWLSVWQRNHPSRSR